MVHSEYYTLKDVKPLGSTKLTNVDGTKLSVKRIANVSVILNGLNTPHSFIVMDNYSALIILTNVDGTKLSVKRIANVSVILNGLNTPHSFIVMDNYSALIIHKCDFLFKYGMTIDFENGTF